MTGQRRRRAAGELESAALAALWTAATPLTPTELQAALGGLLAYNTVHTILTRLLDKGLVTRSQQARRTTYAPVKDAADLAVERMRGALEASGGDRMLVLRRFVTALSAEDERALRTMLELAEDTDRPGAAS